MAPLLLGSTSTRSSLIVLGELRDALSAAVLDAIGCCASVESDLVQVHDMQCMTSMEQRSHSMLTA